jgi:hypothetical protein
MSRSGYSEDSDGAALNLGRGAVNSAIKGNPKIGRKWRRMAEMYKRFAVDYKAADFSESAALEMFLHESTGAPMPDAKSNGYALGKKWMDVTVAAWKEDIPSMGLTVSELLDDGYPEWFLERMGVLHLVPTVSACVPWAGREILHLVLDRVQGEPLADDTLRYMTQQPA